VDEKEKSGDLVAVFVGTRREAIVLATDKSWR